ncbi:MAG: triose-phosphate isomerase [Anaerolineae bacterium]|nr:triose-phosphate isomerase [Anaerolineae bacterium]
MRTPNIAANWKMYKTAAEARSLVQAMLAELQALDSIESVLCPPFTALEAVSSLVRGTRIGVGAQDMYWEEQGAYTGEISPLMVKELAQYVIIGHSERRQYFGETDETVNRKVRAALAHGLTPIVAVGENLAQNEAGETESFVSGQVRRGLAGLSREQARRIIVAYEPIWAIGTGRPATGEAANRIIGQVVRGTLDELFGHEVAQGVRIQYGGSVKPDNIAEFVSQPEIDGALVGGASLKAADFVAIVRTTAEVKGKS